jgi:beta-phosphoglucomutase
MGDLTIIPSDSLIGCSDNIEGIKIKKKTPFFCIFVHMINNKIIPKTLKAVFFDMDGVLYDSMPNHAQTWVESFQAAGINFPAYEAYLNEGRTGPSTIKVAFEKYGDRPATEEDIQKIYDHKTELMLKAPTPKIMPGMQIVLKQTMAAGLQVIVVTGSKQPSLISRLKNDFNIEDENVVSGFDVKKGKPDPEPYLMALKKAECKASEALVIENAPLGVTASCGADIVTIAVNTGILEQEILITAGAGMVLSSTQELADKWESLIK